MPPRLAVRAQPLYAPQTVLGTHLRRGVYVEDLQCSADAFGPLDASWTLRRSSRTSWPDLGFWTPVEIEIENQLPWTGRIISTPGSDADEETITVNAQGYQYSADDRPYTKLFVANDLGRWTDIRSNVNCDLTVQRAVWQDSSDAGGLTVTAPNAAAVEIGSRGGYLLDLGPNGDLATSVLFNWSHSNNSSATSIGILAGSSVAAVSNGAPGAITTLSGGTGGPSSIALGTPSRYVWLGLYNTSGSAFTASADIWAKFSSIIVVTSNAYASGGASILKASDVLLDTFNRLPLVPTGVIGTTTFSLPTFSVDQQTPRQAMDAANAFQDWQWRITADRVLEYRARPQTALLSLSDQAAFDDLSAGSGDAIYNEVTYTGTGPDGTAILVTRTPTLAGLPLTIPDKRGVTKGITIQSSAPLTSAAASQLCDVFLSQRNTTPFKGTIHATSRRSVTINPAGTNCPPYQLLRYPGELVNFRHLQNPDTGALGRDGRIAKVSYTWSTDSAEVDIDTTAGSYEAMLSRLAVVTTR